MVQRKDRKKWVIVAAIVGVLVVALATVTLIRALNPKSGDPYVQNDTSGAVSSDDGVSNQDVNAPTENSTDTAQTKPATDASTLDPATVSTIDIAPMFITVSYVKGLGAFEFRVLRTPSGTQYVEFTSPELIGTKCTDDKGAFVSIIQNPSSSESNSTVSQTVDIDTTKYGLALSGTNCTANVERLEQYQQSFAKAFSLLKKTN